MRYTVIWQPHAEQRLAAIWNDAANRQAVTAAADWVDAALENDAHLLGESLYGTMRVVVEPPLAVYFDVSAGKRSVRLDAAFPTGSDVTVSRQLT